MDWRFCSFRGTNGTKREGRVTVAGDAVAVDSNTVANSGVSTGTGHGLPVSGNGRHPFVNRHGESFAFLGFFHSGHLEVSCNDEGGHEEDWKQDRGGDLAAGRR